MPVCLICKGSGKIVLEQKQRCCSCDGVGEDDLGYTCLTCHGRGCVSIGHSTFCPACQGSGYCEDAPYYDLPQVHPGARTVRFVLSNRSAFLQKCG